MTTAPTARPDVIVVGAGSAGCVVARRIAESGLSVALVEAGPGYAEGTPPSISGESFLAAAVEPGWSWSDLVAQRVKGQEPRLYLRGRGVGGSSAINAMMGIWGEPDDFDRWERDHGCAGWSWSDVEAYFRRVAIPLHPADRRESHRLGSAVVDVCREWGWADHDGPAGLGTLRHDAGAARLTRDADGRRASAYDVYVVPALGRLPIDVLTDRAVERVLIEHGRATGVEFADGTTLEGRAVVVSAGAIHSPWLLERSGVSNPAIGDGLQDHASAPFTLVMKDPADPTSLAVTALARTTSGAAAADLQILPIDHLGDAAPGLASLSVALMNVHSRGSTTEGRINFDMLSDERDVAAISAGVAVVRRLLDHPALRSRVESVQIDDLGTPLDRFPDDEDGLVKWLSERTGDYVHAVGTCAMGPKGTGVVDTLGRSWDVMGLWVCDASVMPRLPRANTHLATCMVAEKMSESLPELVADLDD